MVSLNSKYSELSLLLDPSCGIMSDVTFKIVRSINKERAEDSEVLGEIKGHKVILAAFSPVFKSMFFGPLKETKDVIHVEQTTLEAFEKMIEYIYQSDIDWSALSLLELYDIINLAELFNLPKLTNEIKTQMEAMPLTMESLMEVAHTAAQFTQFEEVSSALLLTCSKFLQKTKRTPADQLQFALDQLDTGREKTVLQLLTLVKSNLLACTNCGEDECLNGKLVDTNEKCTVGLKIKVNKNRSSYWGPNGGSFATKCYTVIEVPNGNTVKVKESENGHSVAHNFMFDGGPLFCYSCC